MKHKLARHATVVATTIILAACAGRSDESPEAGDVATLPAVKPVARADRDPCSLITKEEAETILGATFNVAQRTNRGGGPPSCEYTPANSKKFNGFTLTVYWTGGKDALATTKAGSRIARTMMKTNQTDPMSITAIEAVDDLGDEAYFNPVMGSSVLKNDTLLEFDITAMMWHQPSREAGLELWKQLVNKALARL